jgi:rare lipoprotein A
MSSSLPSGPARSPAAVLPLVLVLVLGLMLASGAGAHAAPVAAAAPGQVGGAVAHPSPERVRVREAPHRVLAGREVRLSGVVTSRRRGRPVVLQLRTQRGWRTVDRARTRRDGAFVASWRPDVLGRHALRARPGGGGSGRVGPAARPRVVRVFRLAMASWFGPGFYGRRTACGRTLGLGTLGVAHKRLRCGTRVTFAHAGRTVTIPVIDRGPYVGAREWDLTAAARQRLRAPSTGMVWSSK